MTSASRPRLAVALVGASLTVALVAIALVGVSLAPSSAATGPAQRFIAGYYTPSDLLDVAGHTVDVGTYQISYVADVRFEEPVDGARLACALRDPNTPALRFQPDSSRTIGSSPATQHIEFTGIYALPPMSFGLRCHTSVTGPVRILFTNVSLTTREGG